MKTYHEHNVATTWSANDVKGSKQKINKRTRYAWAGEWFTAWIKEAQ